MFKSTMYTFRYPFVQMPLTYRRAFVCLSTGLLLLGTQTSCEKTSSPSSQPTAADSSVKAASEGILGKAILFTADSERYRVSGWSGTEGNFAWTDGASARLALPVPADAGPLSVKMTLRGFVHPPALPSQPVEVYANNQKVADWEVSDSAAFTAKITTELTKTGGGTLSLELRMPKAASPKTLGVNTDDRILGVCAYSIEVSSAPVTN